MPGILAARDWGTTPAMNAFHLTILWQVDQPKMIRNEGFFKLELRNLYSSFIYVGGPIIYGKMD